MPDIEQLREVSDHIARMRDAENFEAMSIIPPIGEGDAFPVSFTNLHIISGSVEPTLHKTELVNPTIPSELASKIVAMCTNTMTRTIPVLNNDSARSIAHSVKNATEDLRSDATQGREFETVGVLAICLTTAAPFVYEFVSKRFISAFINYDSSLIVPPVKDIPEEALRQYYAMESEHKADIPPYEVWRAVGLASLQGDASAETQKHNNAMAITGMLALPSAITHPVFTSELF